VNIVIFSTADADHLVQRPHQLACAFSRLGCRVSFVNPITNVISSPIRRLFRRLNGHASRFPCTTVDVVDIYQIQVPLWRKPLFGYHARPEALRTFLRHRLATMSRSACAAILSHPFMFEYIPVEMFSVIVYDFFDDDTVFGGSGQPEYREMQQRLIDSSHVFITTSPVLTETLRRGVPPGRSLLEIPNGVDADWFRDRAQHAMRGKPAHGQKTVGYVGAIFDWIDCELILQVATLRPELRFELVGPVSPANRKRLSTLPRNVHLVGEIPYDEVPGHVAAFDVCMIPFSKGAIADSTDPIKLYEYFSLGKPVVATPMKQLEQYQALNMVRIADGPESFAAAIDEMLATDSEDLWESRMAVATGHSWQAHAGRILNALQNALTTEHTPK
jgi:glycosyltransferase involved in cell wall biosynthesis